jgi:hypothetical protein
MSPRMQVSVSEDRQQATLSFLPGSGVEGQLELNFEQLSQLILSLGQVRAAMQEARPVPSMEGATVTPVFNTPWTVRPEALTEGSVIAFQHPAFGPVGFVLAAPDAEKVVRALGVHLRMVHTSERPQGKPS